MTATSALIKKTAGTSALLFGVLAAALAISGQASAFFSFIGGDLDFNGRVTQVNGSIIQIEKSGVYPLPVVVDTNSDFTGGYADINSVSVGDQVRVEAREDQGALLLESIEPVISAGYGYGTACEAFNIEGVTVSSIEDGAVYLSRAGITFYTSFDNNTVVLPGSQSIADLTVGEQITAIGQDCGQERLVGQTFIRGATTSPTDPGGGPVVGNFTCEGITGYGLHNTQFLLSHDAGGAFTPAVDLAVPAGNYDVYGVSYDDHSNHAWDTLANESWRVEGWYNGSQVYSSNATNDLPDGIDRNTTLIGGNVAISELDQIRFVHNAYVDPTYQSILPECVIFVPTNATAVVGPLANI